MNYKAKQQGERPVFFESKVKNYAFANESTVLKKLKPSPEATEGFCTAEGKYREPEGGCKVGVAGREKKMKERRKQQEWKEGDEERKKEKGKGKEKEKKGDEEQRTDFLRVIQGTQRSQQSLLRRAENLGQAQTPQRIPQIKINGLEQFEHPEQVQGTQPSQQSPKQAVKRVAPTGHIQKPHRVQAHHSTSSHPVTQPRPAQPQRSHQIPSPRRMGETYQGQQMHQLQQVQRGFEQTLPFSPAHVPGQGVQYIAQQAQISHTPVNSPVPRPQQQQQFFSPSSAARRGHIRYPTRYGTAGDPALQVVRNFQNLQDRKDTGGE
ncbi:hypothetical protein HYALB_00010235 [Hymenoscyphus albidus]|uniref:Uncharacterized protein n=1 Tax=Hymenoscyphus albidus TaxID=595503 RepID=A0A9N9Q5F9_9HELO|nr:hypothetical protein HYALB_00010235 [Hymenoscyphus albidus]